MKLLFRYRETVASLPDREGFSPEAVVVSDVSVVFIASEAFVPGVAGSLDGAVMKNTTDQSFYEAK